MCFAKCALGVALSSLVSSGSVWAQFDDSPKESKSKSSGESDADLTKDFEDGDDKKNDATKGLPEAKLEQGEEGSADRNDFAKSAEITKAEIEELSAALKKRSEPQLIKAAAAILSKNPTHLETLNAMAVYYFESKKFGMAKLLLKRAMKDHPNEPALFNNLGIIYLSEGETRLAIENFRKSISAKADYKIGATNLGSIYLDYRDYKRSIAPLEEGYKAVRSDVRRGDTTAVEIANNYGVALMGTGENGKAEEVFSEIVSANSRNPTPYLNYAILLVEVQKKKNDAVRVLSKLKFMTDDREILRRVDELERKLE